MFFGIMLMAKFSEVWLFGDHLSAGMKIEIDRLNQLKKGEIEIRIIKLFTYMNVLL